MGKTLVEMAAELVQAQCSSRNMATDEITSSLQATYNALHALQSGEEKGEVAAVAGTMKPEKSIQKHKITCLECGKEFQMISAKHLASHGLTGREYRKKWGFSLRQPLCAKVLSERRKKASKDRGLPANLIKFQEQRKKKSAAGGASGKGTATRKGKVAAKSAAPRKTVIRKRAAKPAASGTTGSESK